MRPFHQPYFFGLDRNERYKIEYSKTKPRKKPFVKTYDGQYISLSDACEVPQISRTSHVEVSNVEGHLNQSRTTQTVAAKRKNPIWKSDLAKYSQEISQQVDYFAHIEAQLRIDQARSEVHKNSLKTETPVQTELAAQKDFMVIRSVPCPNFETSALKSQSATRRKRIKKVQPAATENDFRCVEHPIDWHDQLTSQDSMNAPTYDHALVGAEGQVLELKVTSTNEDNIFHCLFGKKEPFRCDSTKRRRAAMVQFLKSFEGEHCTQIPTILYHFLMDPKNHSLSPEMEKWFRIIKSKDSNKEKSLMKVLVKSGCDEDLKRLAASTSDDDLLKFIENCNNTTALKEISNFHQKF